MPALAAISSVFAFLYSYLPNISIPASMIRRCFSCESSSNFSILYTPNTLICYSKKAMISCMLTGAIAFASTPTSYRNRPLSRFL